MTDELVFRKPLTDSRWLDAKRPRMPVEAVEDWGDIRRGKTYVRLLDELAEDAGLWRVVDESGESYCYPKGWFVVKTDELGISE